MPKDSSKVNYPQELLSEVSANVNKELNKLVMSGYYASIEIVTDVATVMDINPGGDGPKITSILVELRATMVA